MAQLAFSIRICALSILNNVYFCAKFHSFCHNFLGSNSRFMQLKWGLCCGTEAQARIIRPRRQEKKEHKQQYKEAQKTFQAALKTSHWLYINNILCTSLEEGNFKSFYKYVKSKREDRVGVSQLKEDGVLHTSPVKISEIVAKQFRSVFTNDKDKPFSETCIQGPSYPPKGELVIRDEGVEKRLAGIDPNKAAGLGEIPCRVLKELAHELALYVVACSSV